MTDTRALPLMTLTPTRRSPPFRLVSSSRTRACGHCLRKALCHCLHEGFRRVITGYTVERRLPDVAPLLHILVQGRATIRELLRIIGSEQLDLVTPPKLLRE